MEQRAKQEKYEIINDLAVISRELEGVAGELKAFKGIGAELCTKRLHEISDKYKNIKNQLYSIGK
jgi:hypothetical protein